MDINGSVRQTSKCGFCQEEEDYDDDGDGDGCVGDVGGDFDMTINAATAMGPAYVISRCVGFTRDL